MKFSHLAVIILIISASGSAGAAGRACEALFQRAILPLGSQPTVAKALSWVAVQETAQRPELAVVTLASLEKTVSGIDEQLAEMPNTVRIIPTAEELDHRKIMQMWGGAKFPMGLSADWINVDMQRMSAATFAKHDLIHASLWLQAVSSYGKLHDIANAKVLKRFETLNQRLLLAFEKASTPSEKLRLEYLWFHLVHEGNLVILNAKDLHDLHAAKQIRTLEVVTKYLSHLETPEFIAKTGTDPLEWEASYRTLERLIIGGRI